MLLNLETDQMDVNTAFLNGKLNELIFMDLPTGFRDPNCPNLVCKLLKAIYGLMQAHRQWYAEIHDYLKRSLGFKICPHAPFLYIKHLEDSITIIALSVDDLIIAENITTEINKVKAKISNRFKMKDFGEVKKILDLTINRDPVQHTLDLSKTDYIDKILERFHLTNDTLFKTTMEVPSSRSVIVDPNDRPCNMANSHLNRIGMQSSTYSDT